MIEKSGAYYSWKGERIGQGRDNACKWMTETPAAEQIRGLLVANRKEENAGIGGIARAPGPRPRTVRRVLRPVRPHRDGTPAAAGSAATAASAPAAGKSAAA